MKINDPMENEDQASEAQALLRILVIGDEQAKAGQTFPLEDVVADLRRAGRERGASVKPPPRPR